MDFLKLAEDRYSVRKFLDRPVESEKLELILQAGLVAPTACNKQPFRILAITQKEGLEKLQRCTRSHFNAPAALLVCSHGEECWKRTYDGRPSGEIDASIVTTHMMLEAASLGIGSCWVMHFRPQAVREEFSVPDALDPVALLVMGYPAPDAAPYPGHTEFRAREELVFYDKF
ncbi:MAG: nitroreductase family protein [Clostridia bacterium]|nr:nitroreductase family protein [Clostridia bacterium]